MNVPFKSYTVFLGCLLATSLPVAAQIISFPDPQFKNALVNTLCVEKTGDYKGDADADTNNDGEIDVNEALAVTRLYVTSQGITSLEGIEYFTNLTLLNADLNQITALDITPLTKLQTLEANDNNIAEIHVTNLPKLKILAVSSNQIESLDLTGTTSLDVLGVGHNQLTELDVTPQTVLRLLEFVYNQITSIQVAGKSTLQVIQASNNPIGTLDLTGCPLLYALTCNSCQLDELDISGQPNLLNLECNSNNLSTLDLAAQTKLNILKCADNQLQALDVSKQPNLVTLFCGQNKLNNLDLSQLTNLVTVDCWTNELGTLSAENCSSLKTLRCQDNQLTSLNLNGCTALEQLSCSNNQLTSLDLSSCHLTFMSSANNNQLSYLILKNGFSDQKLSFSGNPNLAYVCVDEVEFNAIHAKLAQNGNGSAEVNGYCSFSPGGDVLTVQGKLRYDVGLDGCSESDPVRQQLKIHVDSGTESGFFLFPFDSVYVLKLPPGQHQITPEVNASFPVTITPDKLNLNYSGTGGDEIIQDFCLVPSMSIPDVGILMTPLNNAVPGFACKYRLTYTNNGTTVQDGSITLTYDDQVLTFTSSQPVADDLAPQTISWDFADLHILESRFIFLEFLANKPTDSPPLNAGDILPFVATIHGDPLDVHLEDNIISIRQPVRNSLDPNDKTCLTGEILLPEDVGDDLLYLIRFENTGTYPAANVIVKDVLDVSKLDPSTLEVTASSHPVKVRVDEDGVAEFYFENIQLPFEEGMNDGFVTFMIATRPSLNIGDIITNQASIYFDYNHPIVTNMAQTTVDVQNVLSEPNGQEDGTLYPNPSMDGFFFSRPERIESVHVTDASGTLVFTSARPESWIDTRAWPQGVYTVLADLGKGKALTLRYVKSAN
ncbi:MAG: T9SS type A sorting domain-containing protein [Saprospiraceae bacterium]|nr:T9SS type A sorting domain-containing protein [Saprospiraceae bacterium]